MNSLATWSLLMLLLHCASSQNVQISPTHNRTILIGMDDDFQVTCTVPRRTTTVQWYKNGDLIVENDRISNTISRRLSRLTVQNIRQSDSGYYQCEYNNSRSSFSGYVNVISIQITAPSPQQLIYHTNGTIQCSSLNETFLSWHTVAPEENVINDNGTYHTGDEGLSITNVQLYHQQQYKCEHSLASNPHLVRRIIIDVEVLVPSMVTSSPTNASVVKGQTLSISFTYLAIPAPNFTWYINDNLHTEVEPTSGTTDTHTMTFSNANKEGWYRCVVQNEYGTAEYTVFVDILIPPEITSIDSAVVAVGGDTSLSCASSGDAPISFQWVHSGRTLSNGGRISGANTNTLIITGLIEADNGTYTCIATNDHGNDSADASVIVVGLPKRPGMVNINNQSTTAVITWTIVTNTLNHPVDYVFISYRITGSSDVTSVRVSSNTSQLTLQDLIPGTPYTVDVIPSNMAGNYTDGPHPFTTTVGAPMIETLSCASDSYTSIQLAIILKYTGGRPVIEFHIRHRIAGTTGWSSLVMGSNHSNAKTPWNYSLTGLSFDQRGYEVEVTAMNSIGPSNAVSSSPAPIMLLTDLPGRPRIWEPSSSSITENSTTITCQVSDVGQPPLNRFTLTMISPIERVFVKRVSSDSAGANVSIEVNGLSSGTEYVFACYASSVVGNGEQSRQIIVRTNKPSSTASDSSSGGTQNMGIYIGVTAGIILIVLLLIIILLLYFCCVRKSKQENSYFVKGGPLSAEENQFQISPGVMRRQFNFEQAGATGSSITRHQVSDSVSSKQEGLQGIRFSNTMSSAQEGLSSIRYSNTVTSNQGGLSSLQFSSQPSPISNGHYVPLSQQVSNGISSSCATRQLSNPTSNLNLQPGCSGSTATYPLSMDRITAHYHISGSLTSSSLYDDDDSKLSYPPSTFATVV